MNEERREVGQKVRVGIFVLVALVAFLGMIYALGARARLFEPRYTVHADFTEVGGLTEGATVRLAGVQIGRVTDVRLPARPGGKVRVDLNIARQFADRVRRNSVARIETQGLLGDKIVELTVGTAEAPAAQPGDVIEAQDPLEVGRVIGETADIVRSVGALATSLRRTAETLNRSKVIEDASAAMASARRLTDHLDRVVEQAEKGRGWAHVLLYEEPVALRKINDLLETMQAVLERVGRGEGAAGVLTSSESTAAARRFVAAMDRIGRMAERPADEDGLLPRLLFDPRYRSVLEDLRAVSHNLRDVSDRLAGGRGLLGSLVRDEADDGSLRRISRDLEVAVANLRAISQKVNEGDGTLGALIADPTVYERLVKVLDGAQRSWLLRSLLRGLGDDDAGPAKE